LADTPTQVGTTSSYTIQPADLGYTFFLKVTGTKTGYTSHESISNLKLILPGSLVKTPVPKITGTYKAGNSLKAVPGSWDAGTTFSYQWLRDGIAIAKATSATYKLVAKDKAHKISVKVIGNKIGFTSIFKVSLASKVN
jgi:hypothetical protein